MTRRWFVALALLASSIASTAPAAEWPNRPIRIVAPSTPGGAADTFARLLAEFLPPLLHQPLIVDNRAGGGGLIGAAAAAHAEPDGYTLVTASIAYHAIAPAVSPNPGFDPIRDFTHIAFLGGPPNVFVVHPALGVHSLKELIALARSGRPIDYVSPGVGTLGHLLVESFAQKAGIAVQHIPHKGSSQAMMDLVAGNVMIGSMTWSSAAGQVRAGTVVPIVVSSSARIAELPDVPTLREEGFDDLVAVTWYALSGPAGLPDDVVQKLNRAVNAAWATPALRWRLADDAITAEPMSPQAVTLFVANEVRKWGPIAKRVVANP
ncbi:MAG TPA: tripartite tricarboxylate transporter substrate binding protein [Xanthobacteraceae bacterium]|nr:tripartite tricarboxylate transporter substrate binding protein [Xanthobacteraceae bacterium]